MYYLTIINKIYTIRYILYVVGTARVLKNEHCTTKLHICLRMYFFALERLLAEWPKKNLFNATVNSLYMNLYI